VAKQVAGRNGGTINQLQKGESGNPNGRPRKFISELKDQGYKLAEVNDCIQVMLSMTFEELAEIFKNPKATVLEKTVASAIKKGIEKGDLISIETLLNRVYGRPKEKIEQTHTHTLDMKKLSKETLLELQNATRNTTDTD
jgi:hypothetical protein